MFARSGRSWGVPPRWWCRRTFLSANKRVEENDRLILRMREDPKISHFTKPMKSGRTIQTKWGAIDHDLLLGKESRDIVSTNTGRDFRVHFPTLEEYVIQSPRLVTPVYPADANLIVSLLDLHVSPYRLGVTDLPLEILEAGTGHGSLTLHLARAIHGANSAPPVAMVPEFRTAEATSSTSNTPHPTAEGVLDAPIRAAYEEIQTLHKLARTEWKANRRAVIHTVDVSSHYSQHAEKIFSSFRRGIYVGDADFHVNDVGEWLDQQMSIRDLKSSEPTFLSHAILDLPGSHDHVEKVASALHPDGVLIVFNPSITQILRSIKMIREKKIPLWLDRVVELGAGLTGGREWDVRTARPRASLRAEKARTEAQAVKGLGTSEETNVLGITNEGPMQSAKQDQEHIELLRPERSGFETICRPKVGERITGGGFLGVWRKMKSLDTSATAKSNV